MPSEIEKYQGFKAELAVAETFEELKFIESKAAAAAEFARKNKIGLDEQNQWGRFRVEIDQKKGDWLAERFPVGGRGANQHTKEQTSPVVRLADEGISFKESAQARNIFRNPGPVKEIMTRIVASGKIITPTLVNTELVKEQRQTKIKEQVFKIRQMPQGSFDLIYCDPPWKYDFAETDNRKIENQYPTMTVDEICQMELPNIASNSLLLMWATAPKLLEAIKVIAAWGFTYKTHGIWDKVKIGMGYWFRGQHELLIVATKGNFSPPDPSNRNSSIYVEARGQHSSKPDFFYEWIEKAFPLSHKIELFSRTKRDGWEAWGNE